MSKLYPNFNGTVAEYKSLHKWVRRTFAKPEACDKCGTKRAKGYDWASIDNRYTKTREDWEYLCRSCHIKSDGRINQLNKGGGEGWAGWKHTDDAKKKMSDNHWIKRKGWKPRERDKHGRFI